MVFEAVGKHWTSNFDLKKHPMPVLVTDHAEQKRPTTSGFSRGARDLMKTDRTVPQVATRGEWVRCETGPFPSVFKEGWLRH